LYGVGIGPCATARRIPLDRNIDRVSALAQAIDDVGIHVRAAMKYRTAAQFDVAFLMLLDRRTIG
jgi:hypothetical protein